MCAALEGTCGGQKFMLEVHFSFSSPYFHSLVNPNEADCLETGPPAAPLVSSSQPHFFPVLPCAAGSDSYVNSGDLNPGPHTCIASTSNTEGSPSNVLNKVT